MSENTLSEQSQGLEDKSKHATMAGAEAGAAAGAFRAVLFRMMHLYFRHPLKASTQLFSHR